MLNHTIKLPDVGEGVAEAELVEWHVKVGDLVREDMVLAAVMTDKATVEIPSPVDGTVVWLGAEIGETVAVGSPIVRIEVAGEGDESQHSVPEAPVLDEPPHPSSASLGRPLPAGERSTSTESASPPSEATTHQTSSPPRGEGGRAERRPGEGAATGQSTPTAPRPEGERPLASPAVRIRAREASIDLRQTPGTGPAGRITHEDLDAFVARGREPVRTGLQRNLAVEEIKLVGLRRRIAEKMSLASSRIPHITYVEEVDVTALEELRGKLNAEKRPADAPRPKLTLMPFLMRAMVKAIADQPQLNATFDDDAGIIHRHGGVHIGVAAQTPSGLMVPVVRHAEARDLWDCAAELARPQRRRRPAPRRARN
jgi:2-oxoisovalerate dehydrogenase E2 component (dihydrolipoyl transacylase)